MRRHAVFLFAIAAAALGSAACHGPALHLDNPDGHRVFVDGIAAPRKSTTVPFRYYGTTRLDTMPADVGGRTDFDHAACCEHVEVAPPVPQWLFPLDFPLEVLLRPFTGSGDTTAAITVAPTPPAGASDDPAADLSARAHRARTTR